jgi:hypothetical protein
MEPPVMGRQVLEMELAREAEAAPGCERRRLSHWSFHSFHWREDLA